MSSAVPHGWDCQHADWLAMQTEQVKTRVRFSLAGVSAAAMLQDVLSFHDFPLPYNDMVEHHLMTLHENPSEDKAHTLAASW